MAEACNLEVANPEAGEIRLAPLPNRGASAGARFEGGPLIRPTFSPPRGGKGRTSMFANEESRVDPIAPQAGAQT